MTSAVAITNHAPVAASAQAGKYLTFILGRECYGLPILRVREIIRFVPPIQVPQLPEHIKGVINLRGKVIPVVDLRLKFGFPANQASERNCVIVVQVFSTASDPTFMGLVVDGVEEVVQVSAHEIEATPDFGAGLNTGYILGLAKIRGTVKTLLDIDQVLPTQAFESICNTLVNQTN